MNIFRMMVLMGFWVVPGGAILADPNPQGQVPDPDVLRQAVWNNMILRDFTLEGVLRTEEEIHPIVLRTKGRVMVYQFQEKPLQIRVQLTPSGSIVERRSSSDQPWQMVSGAERLNTILDSDVAYEDLGVDFLRWSSSRPVGTDSIKTLAAWAYEAEPPALSQYAKARYWISSDYLSVLRVDAFNEKDEVIKRVEVNGVMKVGESYVIKELMVANMVPGRELSRSRSYIQIKRAEPGSGL